MNYARLLATITCVLCLGIGVFFFLLEQDQHFKKFVEKNLKIVFLENFSCTLDGTVKKISILGAYLELQDVVTISKEKDLWQWRAKKFSLRFSWLNFFITRQINLSVHLEDMYAQSRLKGTDIGIVHHLIRLMGGAPGFPVGLHELHVQKGFFRLQDFEHAIEYTTRFVIHAHLYRKALKLDLKTVHGCIRHQEKNICKEWACSLGASVKNVQDPSVYVTLHGSIQLPDLGDTNNTCAYTLSWQGSHGSFSFKNNDESLCLASDSLTLVNTNAVEGTVKTNIPLSFGQKLCLGKGVLQGQAKVTVAGLYSDNSQLDGLIHISDIACSGISLGDLAATFGSDLHKWFGDFSYTMSNTTLLQGSWFFDRAEHEGRMECANPYAITIPSVLYTVPEQALRLEVDCTRHKGSLGATLYAHDQEGGKKIEAHMHADIQDFLLTLSGTLNDYTVQGQGHLNKAEPVLECKVHDPRKKCVFSAACSLSARPTMSGFFAYSMMQQGIEAVLGQKIIGEGTFLFTGTCDTSTLDVSLSTENCNIRVPAMYNLLRGIQSSLSVDFKQKQLLIREAKVQLDRGSLEAKRALVMLDDTYAPAYAYLPCRIIKTLLTFEKDIFCLLSGNFLFLYKKDTTPSLKGALIIERGYVKKNIFSLATEQSFSFFKPSLPRERPDCLLDVRVESKDSIPIRTSFLDASARMNIAVQGSLQNPLVSGDIKVERGTLAFPYKSLTISKARIHFLPTQLFDPYFELVAKGMVRKYHIVLRCDGSLQNPRISFASTPPLSEEQIITLLLAGSEEGSLSVVMPSVLMQSIQNVLFGPEQSSSRLERYFKDILGPFKHIRFVPKFFDPQGRGGFRGAIEVDVNDQLHGIIQRNFSLPEDIKLEVEYFFADDSALRIIRDERGDFGGEVEMRWKF